MMTNYEKKQRSRQQTATGNINPVAKRTTSNRRSPLGKMPTNSTSANKTASSTAAKSGVTARNRVVTKSPSANRGVATTPGFRGGTDKRMKTKIY